MKEAHDGAVIDKSTLPPVIRYKAIPHPIPHGWREALIAAAQEHQIARTDGPEVKEFKNDMRIAGIIALEKRIRAAIGVEVVRDYIPPVEGIQHGSDGEGAQG